MRRLARKTDRIDARVFGDVAPRGDLVPEIWLPDPQIRRERELARFRLHLVRHRTALKNRIHAALVAFGYPCPVSDLFGASPAASSLDRFGVARSVAVGPIEDISLQVIDDLDQRINELSAQAPKSARAPD